MLATVEEVKAILPADALTDNEIQDLLDLAAIDTGDNHSHHLNKAVKLAITKLRLAGKLPDSATVGPLKSETDLTGTLKTLSDADSGSRLPLLYYNRVGGNNAYQ